MHACVGVCARTEHTYHLCVLRTFSSDYYLLLSIMHWLDFHSVNQDVLRKEVNLLQKTLLKVPAQGFPLPCCFQVTQNVKPNLKWCGHPQDAVFADEQNMLEL